MKVIGPVVVGDPLCPTGKALYYSWSKLLDEKRPHDKKNLIKDTQRARGMYVDHRKWWQDCPPWMEHEGIYEQPTAKVK